MTDSKVFGTEMSVSTYRKGFEKCLRFLFATTYIYFLIVFFDHCDSIMRIEFLNAYAHISNLTTFNAGQHYGVRVSGMCIFGKRKESKFDWLTLHVTHVPLPFPARVIKMVGVGRSSRICMRFTCSFLRTFGFRPRSEWS